MKRIIALACALVLIGAIGAAAQPKVSEKQEVAIFALGYTGWNIPYEALGTIDIKIQKVFVDLGRFTVIGMTQRFASPDVGQFIDTLRKAKEASFVIPEKYQFGEAILTEAEFQRLTGAFVIAVPVVTNFATGYNGKSFTWETSVKTAVSFIDASAGTLIGIAEMDTSGSDKQSQNQSIMNAIDGIPMQLQYEIRKIPQFQINTRVLTASGGEIKLQLGANMGIRKGDEYSVISGGMVEGFKDEREVGLIVIKDVGAEVSTGQVLYSGVKMSKDVALREIARLGIDTEPFFHAVIGERLDVPLDPDGEGTLNSLVGFRGIASRGFYGVRPYAAFEVPLNGMRNYFTAFMVPINVLVGAEYRMNLGRLSVTPYAGVGASYIYVTELVTGYSADTSDTYLFHVGAQAFLNLSFLVTRDVRIFVEGGAEGWLSLSDLFTNYGGIGGGAGVSIKF
ncbi:MAG: hypothetical protein NT080_03075 [Spirochaetes bacterium]|nr:hypothetical protein [Spirochaetota bacterium]